MTDGGRCFLATFHPLVRTASGRLASDKHALPPFIDGSCRREPDFESKYPSITATCRAANFAPRLCVGDRVAYLTVKGRYDGDERNGWRLVSVLRVLHRFESHVGPARWYRRRGMAVPGNCIVPGNPPKALSLTSKSLGTAAVGCTPAAAESKSFIRAWDAVYRRRVARWPVFLACVPEYLELWTPPQLLSADIRSIFGRIPATLTPPAVPCGDLRALRRAASLR